MNSSTLLDIMACPLCKVRLYRLATALACPVCRETYPVMDGIPIMLPDRRLPKMKRQSDLIVRNDYDPWFPQTILRSLFNNQVALEVGSGNMGVSIPNIIRMDIILTPHVDLVADVHALPFLPESLDFIFSLAVMEHIRNPFQASQSMYSALKDGGYIYHECNFVFAYHGYPYHFFNATAEGMESVFSEFEIKRQGVAPYQMPSFAVQNVLSAYIHHIRHPENGPAIRFIQQLEEILDQDLQSLDAYFTQQAALNLAAGTYLVGQKKLSSHPALIPPVLRDVWQRNPDLQERFPIVDQVMDPENIMIWAKREGRSQFPEIENFLSGLTPFDKGTPFDRKSAVTSFHSKKYYFSLEADIGSPYNELINPPFNPKKDRNSLLRGGGWGRPVKKGWTILKKEGFRVFLGKVLQSWSRRLLS
jgi:uncharacterized protein YbaR (Trm112 family)/SAM-dependent methyltransferase